MEKGKGTEDFVNACDEFYTYLAGFLRKEIEKNPTDLEKLRELSEIVKINAASIKTQKDESKGGKSPLEKTKARANGAQVLV